MPTEIRMQPFRGMTVRVRIIAAILAVTAVGLAVAGAIAYALQHARVMAAIDEELRQEFAAVRTLVNGGSALNATSDAGTDGIVAHPQAVFTSTEELIYEVVRVIPPPLAGGTLGMIDGEAAYRPGTVSDLDLDTVDFTDDVVNHADDQGVVLGTADVSGVSVRYLGVPLAAAQSERVGLFISAIAIDRRLDDLRSVIVVYAWVSVGVLGVVALVGWLVSGRLLQPLRDLRATAARISAGALHERIPVSGKDDIADLSETINAMIGRLEASFGAQSRIVNDVRHELATPVTIVRGHLELVDVDDPADVAETRDLALDELDRMAGLIGQITSLAEAERSETHRPEVVDVGALTREVFEKVRVIPDRTWVLGSVGFGQAQLDPRQVTQAWLQLADNARKYSEPGSRIELGSSTRSDEVHLWVQDSGVGIAPEARERIFDRFGRADDTRGTEGSGLGLAIVQALVRAHNGRIDLDSELGRGTQFTIILPRTDGNKGAPELDDGIFR